MQKFRIQVLTTYKVLTLYRPIDTIVFYLKYTNNIDSMTVDYHKGDIKLLFSNKKLNYDYLRLIIQVNLCDMLIKF